LFFAFINVGKTVVLNIKRTIDILKNEGENVMNLMINL